MLQRGVRSHRVPCMLKCCHPFITYLQVARCQAVHPGLSLHPLDLGSTSSAGSESSGNVSHGSVAEGAAGTWQRMVDRDVVVHELQLGQSHSFVL